MYSHFVNSQTHVKYEKQVGKIFKYFFDDILGKGTGVNYYIKKQGKSLAHRHPLISSRKKWTNN